jgi:hypothetical protein
VGRDDELPSLRTRVPGGNLPAFVTGSSGTPACSLVVHKNSVSDIGTEMYLTVRPLSDHAVFPTGPCFVCCNGL